MGEIFCEALPRIRVVLGRFGVPIIATISADVVVTVRTADGVDLEPPKVYRTKPPKKPVVR